nr:ATP-dependent DNA helicase PIF1-like [Tanacetum cinerariifolium]
EKRLEIGKCNGRLNPGKKQREPTFQVVLDGLALTPCYFAFLTTTDVLEVYMHQFWDSIHKYDTSYKFRMDKNKIFNLNMEIFRDIVQICPRVHGQNFDKVPTDEDMVSFFKELAHTRDIKSITGVVVDLMHQPWRNFATIINRSLSGKTIDRTVSMRNKIGMHTSRNDYLVNTLRFFSVKEESQIYGARLPVSMTHPKMWETKANKTYLGYATGVTPPKKVQKFKKLASPKLTTIPVSPEEPIRKSKRVKRPTKKYSNMPTTGVVIRDTLMMSLSKKKEKIIIEDLPKSILICQARYKEVRKKSLRDFHKPFVTYEGSGAKPRVPDVTREESTESSDQESDSGDDNTQSDKGKGSDSEYETNENETGFESNQEDNEEEVEDDEEENYTSTDDEDETNVDQRLKIKLKVMSVGIKSLFDVVEITDAQQRCGNVIAPKNDTADAVNAKILSLIESQGKIYLSKDEAIPMGKEKSEKELLYPMEYLYIISFSGFPPYELHLKVGSPIMLLRNVNLSGGLCNGTRMIVTSQMSRSVKAQIITGTRVCDKVYIHRIPLTQKDPNLSFTFKRTQFPIKLCYAMTINKSQGQSLSRISICLPEPVFSHGQLYITLSRAASPDGLKMFISTKQPILSYNQKHSLQRIPEKYSENATVLRRMI